MNRMIYIARRENLRSGDIEQGFDLDEAKRACDMEQWRLTERERRNARFYVAGYSVPCDSGAIAADAYNVWTDEQCDLPDSDEYYDLTFEEETDNGE